MIGPTGVGRVNILASLAFATVAAVMLDYVWLGPVPAWVLFLGVGAVAALPSAGSGGRPRVPAGALVPALLLGALMLWVVGVDVLHGAIAETASRLVLLDLTGGALLLVVFVLGVTSGPRAALLILSGILAIQSAVAILQMAGVPLAWFIPDVIAAIAGGRSTEYLSNLDLVSLAEGGRVRGTHILVHKFSSTQGVLTAFVLTMAILLPQRAGGRGARIWMGFAALLGVIATVGTFSRGVVFALVLATVVSLVVLVSDGNRRALWAVMATLVLGAGILVFLTMTDTTAAGRLIDPSSQTNNAGRFEMYATAFALVRDAPLFGNGALFQWTGAVALHSVPMQYAVAYGVIGLVLYAALVGALDRLFVGAARLGASPRAALPARLALGTAVIDAAFHTSGWLMKDIAQWALFGVMLAICASKEALQ